MLKMILNMPELKLNDIEVYADTPKCEVLEFPSFDIEFVDTLTTPEFLKLIQESHENKKNKEILFSLVSSYMSWAILGTINSVDFCGGNELKIGKITIKPNKVIII